MFEWWYAFWYWLNKMVISHKFFEPYVSIGFWFSVIIIFFIVSYILLVFGLSKKHNG